MKKKHTEIAEKFSLATTAVHEGDLAKGLRLFKQVESLASEQSDMEHYYCARLRRAIAYSMTRTYSKAMPLYESSWEGIIEECSLDDQLILFHAFANSKADLGDIESALYHAQMGCVIARENGLDTHVMRLAYIPVQIYEKLGFYSRMLPHLNEIYTLAEKLGDKRYSIRVNAHYGTVYAQLKQYKKAEEYFNKSLEEALKTELHHLATSTYGNLLSLQVERTSSETLYLLTRNLEEARLTRVPHYLVEALSSMADWYLENDGAEQAKQYFDEAYSIASQHEDPTSQLIAYLGLASYFYKLLDAKKTKKHLDLSIKSIVESTHSDLIKRAYSLYYDYEKRFGNDKSALRWLEKLHAFEKQEAKRLQNEAIESAAFVTNVDELLQKLEQERLLIQDLKEAQERNAQQVMALSLELEQKKQTLKRIKKIAHDSESSTSKRTSQQQSTEGDELESPRHLKKFIKEISSSDTSWETFKSGLDRLYPEFTKRLLDSYPDLSPTQLRICCLLKLHLSSKEIGDILRISKRTVDNHREHIRIKFKIPRTVNLVRHLLNL